jgi:uncharacterized membrane protein YbaN (DUF454 family)
VRSSQDRDEIQVINGRTSARKGDREDSGHGTQEVVAAPSRFVRGLLIVAGTICVGLGVLGIFLPLLPTTPFLLLAAACYGSSSRRFFRWLLNNKWFGSYLRDYHEKKGIPLRVKVWAVSLLWVTILFCAAIVVDNLLVRIALILIAGGVTIHVLRIRTLR